MSPDAERILVVGLGSIGARHVRVIRQVLPDADITVLRHRTCADTRGLPIDRCVTRMEEAIAHRPRMAVIASPAPHHLEAAVSLAEAGVHLLVEKPVSHSSEGVAGLIARAAERGVTLMVGYNLRFVESLRQFRALVLAGRVGRVLSVRAEAGQYLPTWRPGADYRQTVTAQRALGGGVLLELSHELDYLRWTFGDADWVSATVNRQSDLDMDAEDTAHLTIGFAADPAGRSLVATLNLDCVRHDATRTCIAIGERGTLRWQAAIGVVDVFDAGASGWQVECVAGPGADDSYAAQWKHFLHAVAAGTAPLVTGADGLAAVRLVDAARESSHSRAVVAVR